ncbi:hypothetical protein [Clostridium tagluense]|uniref:Uncharacterized protein n=1 Tax=Clostridium tagluense TaxID=360422 RepID=A0A401UUM1_9CLOT|nr:hypothetical protein [Clostridium tagluense]GCD13247.1 hypothetical protein Ctaglu_48700 [Clostridium tagluense]
MAEENKVLGIRLDIEERKRFDEFVSEEGKNNKEFLNTLLNLYELNKGKVKNINLVGDIETLEGYTNKIHQTFINIIDKLENQKGDIAEHGQKDLQIYKDKVNNSQLEMDRMKSINSMNNEKLTIVNNDNSTLKKQNNQFQENLQDKLTIIEEYKGKNDTLTGILEEYKGYKTEIEEYKKLLADAQARNIDKENIIKDNEYNINNLNMGLKTKDEAISDLNAKHNAEIEVLKKDNQKELDQLKKESELNIKLAVAEVKEDLNNRLNQEQLKHNAEIEKYQEKYKSLLDDLEKVKITPKATKKDNKVVQNK